MNLNALYFEPFKHGHNFYRMDPVDEGKRRWRFCSMRDNRLHLPGIVDPGVIVTFHDSKGAERGRIDEYGILSRANYAWNGCTPKYFAPLLGWVGTPDFAATIAASHFHDLLSQFARTTHFPLHRSDCDFIFRRMIEIDGSPTVARIYHAAVVKFGSWLKSSSNGEYSIRTIAHADGEPIR